jgi:hypothetical protein
MPARAHPAAAIFGRVLLCLALWAGCPALASDPPPLSEKEIYERDLIQRALDLFGLVLEPQPLGRRIERIELARFPIVEASDPWPDFVNLFHVVTREHIVRQELLFEPGQAYDEERVRESARNLRALPLLFSTVRIVTAQGSRPDQIVVLVITKDLWSIRLNSNGNFGGGIFNFFFLTPSEQNFLGYNQQVSLHYYIDRDIQAIGQIYRVPRLFGARLQLSESLAIRINHHTGAVEGGWGDLLLQRPLFSVDATWGFWVQLGFDLGIQRTYSGASYLRVPIQDGSLEIGVPWIYEYERVNLDTRVQKSFGRTYKTDLSIGYQLRSFRYRVDASVHPDLALLSASARSRYEQVWLPVDDQAGALVGGLRFYEARFARMHNVQTLGLTEDFRLGLAAGLDLIWASPAFGFSQDSFRIDASVSYRWLLGENLLALSGSAGARYFPGHGLEDVETDWIDQFYELNVENVSPSLWGLGRLFVRLRYAYSQFSRSRFRYSLGGDNTLRGFVTGFASGPRLLNFNLEFRTAPWVVYTMHIGLVAFYDAGDAYGWAPNDDFAFHHSAGVGVRWLFPQFDRGTLRIDVGFPLGSDFHSRWVEWFTIAFLQAF